MNPEDIKRHWKDCADEYGTGVHATTPASTIKRLEIDALWRRLKDVPAMSQVLESGCGNGVNCVELAKRFPWLLFTGFDYVPEMIAAAKANAKEVDNVFFFVSDVLALPDNLSEYDVVFTDRCIINLDTWDKQKQAIQALADKVRPGGKLLLIENVIQGRKAQNRLRTHLGLPERQLMPPFNLFFDENELVQYLWDIGLRDVETEDFSSLHDLCLYVLAPALNALYPSVPLERGAVDYGHPLVNIATELTIKNSLMTPDVFGRFGQNVLFSCRKPA